VDEESNPRRRLLQRLAAAAAGGFTATTLAGPRSVSPEESLPPLLRSTPDPLATGEPTLYPVRAGEVGVVAPGYPYGHGLRHGIKTDGSDTTAEVVNWRDSIVGLGTYADPYGLRHLRCCGVLPAGVIRISKPHALLHLPHDAGPTRWGYTIEGAGIRLTTIIYEPDEEGPLMFASNEVYGLTVRNLHFAIADDFKMRNDWLLSESAGPQQLFTFENLAFDGPWKGGVRLSGPPWDPKAANCNSEFKFDRLNIGATFHDAFLVDSDDDALQSGQFLNYWFSNVNTSMAAGSLVRLRKGGHVTITNLDVSGYKPAEESYVLDFPEVGGYSDDIHSLIVRNVRFEPLSPHARFLRCRWERGTVAIDGYDDCLWRNTEHVSFDIRVGNSVSDAKFGKSGEGTAAGGAQYWIANARMSGVHRFVCAGTPGGDDSVPATIQYQNCEFCGPDNDPASRNIHSFIRFAPDGDRSMLLRPHVRFRACRIEAVPNHVTDWDLGVQNAHPSSQAPIKALRFGTSQYGRLPSNGAASMVLAPGALVLRVTWIAPAGRAPNRPYRFELSNGYNDDRRQILSVLEGDDFSAKASRVDQIGYETIPTPLPGKFDPMASATLVLRETHGPGVHPSAQCIVEYI
jgi:hypothetical protein